MEEAKRTFTRDELNAVRVRVLKDAYNPQLPPEQRERAKAALDKISERLGRKFTQLRRQA
jgi:hypothetical protein